MKLVRAGDLESIRYFFDRVFDRTKAQVEVSEPSSPPMVITGLTQEEVRQLQEFACARTKVVAEMPGRQESAC
jgi:hypothetical protein